MKDLRDEVIYITNLTKWTSQMKNNRIIELYGREEDIQWMVNDLQELKRLREIVNKINKSEQE